MRREIAFPAFQPAGAKFASVSAADLRGNAKRMAVTRLAVKRRVGGNQHAFDECAIGQFPEKFLRGVARALFADEFERLQRKTFAQLFAQCFRQIRHRVPAGGAAGVKPVEQLGDAIGRLVPRLERGFQIFARQRFDVRQQHRLNLNRAAEESKDDQDQSDKNTPSETVFVFPNREFAANLPSCEFYPASSPAARCISEIISG